MDPQNFALVDPVAILPPANDSRDRTSPAYLQWEDSLTLDVKERDIRNSILVTPNGERLMVLAGETRRRAAIRAKLAKVPVNILGRPLTKGEMLLETALEQEMRREFSDLENAELYAEIMEANQWSQVELALRLKNRSASQISKVMSVSSKLPDDLKAMIGQGQGKIRPRAAYHLSKATNHDVMRELAQKYLEGLLNVESLEIEVAKRSGKPPKKLKQVKGRTPKGLLFSLPADDAVARGEVAALMEAIKKTERFGLPLSAVPALLKAGKSPTANEKGGNHAR